MASPVLYITRIIPAYRRPVLERLNERLGGRLVVGSGRPPAASSLQSLAEEAPTRFRQVSLRNFWLAGEKLHAQPFTRAFQEYGSPTVLIAEESPRSVTLPWLLRYARKKGVPRLLWGHFSANNRPFSLRYPTNRYRVALARRADGCICYTQPIADMLRPLIPQERLFVAPNTLDTDTLFSLHKDLESQGRVAVRRRLGLPERAPVIAFIGRLIPSKGTDELLTVFHILRKRKKATLLIIGSGPENAAMQQRVGRDAIKDVHFLGAMPNWTDSAPYLFAADVLLNPGYLGLSVNHSFALGLPVVSQLSPHPSVRYHSPEIAFVRSRHNGLLVPHGSTEALLQGVEHIIADHAQYSRNALAYAKAHLTLDRMVDGLVEAIRFAEGR